MSVLTEVKALLDSLGTLGTISIGFMPASPDVFGTLYEYGGQAGERGFGVVGLKYQKPACQLVFRGIAYDYAGPRAKAAIALATLAAVQPGALSGVQYLQIDPQQEPFPVQAMDENHRHRIGFNFYATKEPS